MAVGLECRMPLLDHRVVEYAQSLPTGAKIAGGQGKLPLRRMLDRYVPPAIVDRPKQGFSIPIGDLLRGPLRPWADDLLSPDRIRRDAYLDADGITRMWREHLTGRRDWQQQLWNVLMFQSWCVSTESTRC
jgi:asparagine synthase (glutamine-hydrolysing)